MVYRVYVEKKPGLAHEADALLQELRDLLGLKGLTGLRLLNRYDAEGIDRDLFDACRATVFSEPPLDVTFDEPDFSDARVLAVEYLPGQFDQRADSAAQCIQLLSRGQRPTVRSCRVYLLYGTLSDAEFERVKTYVINPVESREAALALPETLDTPYDVPTTVETLTGFTALPEEALTDYVAQYGLAMDADDLRCCREYFRSEGRDPTITELKMIDTYWSDHCRHTTFQTIIDDVSFEDEELSGAWADYLAVRRELGRTKPVCLMDLGTIMAKYLRQNGKLDGLDASEEINACTVKITVNGPDGPEPWLLLFKNETHNHPTEIEPFGGAATCIGGAIRDPLSGRAYVYAAMRLTGAADPLTPLDQTLPGKLPQRKIVTEAAHGYSSYGNQIGLCTGLVDELYHPGYAAKRMEVGAVIGAAPAANVRRERPAPGDVVILLGGRTGRDGCGGATGSSKSHSVESLSTCGAEVQKGNAPEERKLQRLFRNPEASRLIKRCNDFGAGGVSVAIGELADGLAIDLNAVPTKYEGLDGTELAISESQERMAVVVAPTDADRFLALAAGENLEATVVAHVTEAPRLTMDWNGVRIVDLARSFLDSNGAEKHITVRAAKPNFTKKQAPVGFTAGLRDLLQSLTCCSRQGLSERFDASIGAGTVLMPFGGRRQLTPIQAMVHTISRESGETDTCSVMSWGYDPYRSEQSPYHGSYCAVVESVSKLVAAGAPFRDVYLSFQEYFEKLGRDETRWGKPLSALLGAFRAQRDLEIAAIGGKDSMSGSFEQLHVPPALISFAVTTADAAHITSPEFKAPGHRVVWLRPDYDKNGLPEPGSLKDVFRTVHALLADGKVVAAWTLQSGGAAEGVFKMALGNEIGFRFDEGPALPDLFCPFSGSFLLELVGDDTVGIPLGVTLDEPTLCFGAEKLALSEAQALYESKLEPVYPLGLDKTVQPLPCLDYDGPAVAAPAVKTARPQVLIPVFPGTNCEYDSARLVEDAGAAAEPFIIRNRTADDVARSVEAFAGRVEQAQIIFLPGGFSGGDEPDGSAKFILSFFRNAAVKEAVTRLLDDRGGLMLGICNGFQALIKLGLVPYGRIRDADEHSPTLAPNTIGRHQSRIVRVRVASRLSPWLAEAQVGDVFTVPISHGEGRFLADEALIRQLAERGQIATQYVDEAGVPTTDIRCNPNGSILAVEGITSPDGRVFGKMGHAERIGPNLYRNVPGRYDMGLFRSAVKYFR